MITKEQHDSGTHCKGKGVNCPKCPDNQICYESTDKIVLDEFTANLFKDKTKEQIIMALGHTQRREVTSSNLAYRLRNQRDSLVNWIEDEIKLAEISAENQSNDYFKNLFLGQKVALERVLRQITKLKFTEGK